MMNRYSVAAINNPDDRINFFYWEDMIEYLRNEMEADGRTYRMKITDWKEMFSKENKGKANCQLHWVRINDEGIAELVTRTVRCEDTSILPGTERVTPRGVRLVDWDRAQW